MRMPSRAGAHDVWAGGKCKLAQLAGEHPEAAVPFPGDKRGFLFTYPWEKKESCTCGILGENTTLHEGRGKCVEARAWVLIRKPQVHISP